MSNDVSTTSLEELVESRAPAYPNEPPPIDTNGAALRNSFSVEFDIERVIDVPLAVTLRFGQREMRLREVMDLNPGFLVELDRQIDDPVDLLLGDRVIARGEVVIVDGNYGLRVTEVVQNGSLLTR